jgi:hypothetical protein
MSFESSLKYFKSTDAGQTWGELQDTGVPAHAIWSSVSFARYGDNYYTFVTRGKDAWAYYTTDLENWEQKHPLPVRLTEGKWARPCGTMLHQSALVTTVAGDLSGYYDEQWGIITVVPEMISHPEQPTAPAPADGAELSGEGVELSVTVQGPQAYDVSFYLRAVDPDEVVPIKHTRDAYVGTDMLLREGETARLQVDGLEPGRQYEWYAVVRGALLEYYGAEPDTTSDEVRTDVFTFSVGE